MYPEKKKERKKEELNDQWNATPEKKKKSKKN